MAPINKKMLAIAVAASVITVVLLTWVYFETHQVELKDVYCEEHGPFRFTIKNLRGERTTFEYRWTLNDPMADQPVHEGEGSITLDPSEEQELTFSLPQFPDYDARFYVMYVYIYKDDREIYSYSEQKSTYDWDYSTLPPKSNNPLADFNLWPVIIVVVIVFVVVLAWSVFYIKGGGRKGKGKPR